PFRVAQNPPRIAAVPAASLLPSGARISRLAHPLQRHYLAKTSASGQLHRGAQRRGTVTKIRSQPRMLVAHAEKLSADGSTLRSFFAAIHAISGKGATLANTARDQHVHIGR